MTDEFSLLAEAIFNAALCDGIGYLSQVVVFVSLLAAAKLIGADLAAAAILEILIFNFQLTNCCWPITMKL